MWVVALGSGTSGGVLAPLLMMGAALGVLAGPFLPGSQPALWPLVFMAATLGGMMRAPIMSVMFALELTQDINALLPLLIASSVAYGFTVLAMPRSILTEKISRRGHHIYREYGIDPLERHVVSEVMTRDVATIDGEERALTDALHGAISATAQRHRAFPVIVGARFVGMLDRDSLAEARCAARRAPARLRPVRRQRAGDGVAGRDLPHDRHAARGARARAPARGQRRAHAPAGGRDRAQRSGQAVTGGRRRGALPPSASSQACRSRPPWLAFAALTGGPPTPGATRIPEVAGQTVLRNGWPRSHPRQCRCPGARRSRYGCLGAWLGVFCAAWLMPSHAGRVQSVVHRSDGRVGGAAVRGAVQPARAALVHRGRQCRVAALIGVTCAAHVADVAPRGRRGGVALSIAAMFALRCLHPPRGAVALTAVLGGPVVTSLGYRFVLWPVAVNSLVLLMAALLFNVSARRRYPTPPRRRTGAHQTRDPAPSARIGLTVQGPGRRAARAR